MIWHDKYKKQFGFWRHYVRDVMIKYLNCGDPHMGFARIKCSDCGHEQFLPFSCRRRQFCPSCHQKRVIEFGEHLCNEVLKKVPHRQWVFSIPKRFRIYFLFDRKLLAKFSKLAFKVLNQYLKQSVSYDDAKPGAVIAVHTFGDFLLFNCHLHIICTDGCFHGDGMFMRAPSPDAKQLEELFRLEIFKMLKKEGKITNFIIDNMMSWANSGFNVYCGNTIWPDDEKAIENLARYIVRAAFSNERMEYIPNDQSQDGIAKVIYSSKDGKEKKIFDALDWLATHIPRKREQTVRYYGYYSNKLHGIRKKENKDEDIPQIIESSQSSKLFRKLQSYFGNFWLL